MMNLRLPEKEQVTVAKGKVICLEQVGLPVLPEWLGGDGQLKPIQQGVIANWSGQREEFGCKRTVQR